MPSEGGRGEGVDRARHGTVAPVHEFDGGHASMFGHRPQDGRYPSRRRASGGVRSMAPIPTSNWRIPVIAMAPTAPRTAPWPQGLRSTFRPLLPMVDAPNVVVTFQRRVPSLKGVTYPGCSSLIRVRELRTRRIRTFSEVKGG